jgi:hypothetical protein
VVPSILPIRKYNFFSLFSPLVLSSNGDKKYQLPLSIPITILIFMKLHMMYMKSSQEIFFFIYVSL